MFIKLNIISAFNRLRIKKDDEKLIAFRTRFDLFESLVLFFELCNDSVFFQSSEFAFSKIDDEMNISLLY
jgi:hypothetical protein